MLIQQGWSHPEGFTIHHFFCTCTCIHILHLSDILSKTIVSTHCALKQKQTILARGFEISTRLCELRSHCCNQSCLSSISSHSIVTSNSQLYTPSSILLARDGREGRSRGSLDTIRCKIKGSKCIFLYISLAHIVCQKYAELCALNIHFSHKRERLVNHGTDLPPTEFGWALRC